MQTRANKREKNQRKAFDEIVTVENLEVSRQHTGSAVMEFGSSHSKNCRGQSIKSRSIQNFEYQTENIKILKKFQRVINGIQVGKVSATGSQNAKPKPAKAHLTQDEQRAGTKMSKLLSKRK